jgi:hypothetical protein
MRPSRRMETLRTCSVAMQSRRMRQMELRPRRKAVRLQSGAENRTASGVVPSIYGMQSLRHNTLLDRSAHIGDDGASYNL